jgi:Dipeptidyl aminopeptidases/acylaminoacyl-peptidases
MDAYLTRFEREGEFEFVEGKRVTENFVRDYRKHSFSHVRVRLPTLVVQGSEDRYVPPEQTRQALGSFEEDVRYLEYSGEGHRFSDMAKQELFDEAVGFVRSCV